MQITDVAGREFVKRQDLECAALEHVEAVAASERIAALTELRRHAGEREPLYITALGSLSSLGWRRFQSYGCKCILAALYRFRSRFNASFVRRGRRSARVCIPPCRRD